MYWHMHRAVELILRIALPALGLAVGLFLAWYSLVLLSRDGDDGDGWAVLIPATLMIVLAVFLLVISNTKSSRRRWKSTYPVVPPPD
jgi:hypothetical protein